MTALSVEIGERNSAGGSSPGLPRAARRVGGWRLPGAADREGSQRVDARQNGESICMMDIDVTTLGDVIAHRLAA